ncbi:MAG: hypothetical protein IKN12_05815 [Selenomonadaceae bacterium]|nr:hypothetical protein [Selenomonadaceae bacterium]
MKILVWGAGVNGNIYRQYIERCTEDEFVGFIDNNFHLGGGEVKRPSEIKNLEFDLLVVSNEYSKARQEIKEQLGSLSIDQNKVIFLVEDEQLKTAVFSAINCYDEKTDRRVIWLASFAQYAKSATMPGNVAECGVNCGEFAYYINKYFADKKLYLFDTFDGFASKDLEAERSLGERAFLESLFNTCDCFKVASLDIVKKRMPHLQKCEFHVGYFPASAEGIDDNFCFVNLDTDLYQPILAGLEFFFPKMVDGGVILVHDYFNSSLPGVQKAIVDFENKSGTRLHKFPIADYCSLAIVK